MLSAGKHVSKRHTRSGLSSGEQRTKALLYLFPYFTDPHPINQDALLSVKKVVSWIPVRSMVFVLKYSEQWSKKCLNHTSLLIILRYVWSNVNCFLKMKVCYDWRQLFSPYNFVVVFVSLKYDGDCITNCLICVSWLVSSFMWKLMFWHLFECVPLEYFRLWTTWQLFRPLLQNVYHC